MAFLRDLHNQLSLATRCTLRMAESDAVELDPAFIGEVREHTITSNVEVPELGEIWGARSGPTVANQTTVPACAVIHIFSSVLCYCSTPSFVAGLICVDMSMSVAQVISGLNEKRAAVEKELHTFGSAPKGQKDVYKECSKFHKAYAAALEVAWLVICTLAPSLNCLQASATCVAIATKQMLLHTEPRGHQPHSQNIQQPGGADRPGKAAAAGPAVPAHERQIGERRAKSSAYGCVCRPAARRVSTFDMLQLDT